MLFSHNFLSESRVSNCMKDCVSLLGIVAIFKNNFMRGSVIGFWGGEKIQYIEERTLLGTVG